VSDIAIEMKRQMVKNYLSMHPDSREITVVKDSRVLAALFDNGNFTNSKDGGNIFQSKNVPHFTVFSGDIVDLSVGDILKNSSNVQFKISEIQRDKTEETYQAQLYVVEVKS